MSQLSRRRFLARLARAAAVTGAASCGTARLGAAKLASAEEAAAGLRDPDPDRCGPFRLGREIYRNPLRSPEDVRGFCLEGRARVEFPAGRLRLQNVVAASAGQKSNFVYWFGQPLPADFAAAWDFRPLQEPGLGMVFFGARGRKGEDAFDPGLRPRSGEYAQYHHGDVDLLHLSYFRRKAPEERAFHVCNLRKSYGFNLVAEGADPIPSVTDARPPYRIELIKCGPQVAFYIDRMPVLSWQDDGRSHGPVLGAGRFAFRQMAPLVAEYENFVVRQVWR